jgi:hypothetical protein
LPGGDRVTFGEPALWGAGTFLAVSVILIAWSCLRHPVSGPGGSPEAVLLVGLGSFLIVLGASALAVDQNALSRPYWDQWGEAQELFEPFRSGTLSWATIFGLHNEHRIFPSRILALALFAGDGGWDNRLEATAGAVVHALGAGIISALLVRNVRLGIALPAAMALTTLWALPLARENVVWGFQSQFYFLLLFAPCTLWLLSKPRAGGWILATGTLAAVLAILSLGDGPLAPIALLLVLTAGARWGRLERFDVRTVAILVVLVVLGVLLRGQVGPGSRPGSVGDFVTSMARVLAYPFRSPWAALTVWAPWTVWAIARLLRPEPPMHVERFVAALGVFVLMHGPVVAFARGAGGAGPATRYFDILALGLVANLLALLLLSRRIPVLASLPLSLGWVLSLAMQVRAVHVQMWKHELPGQLEWSFMEDRTLARYLQTSDLAMLKVPHGWGLPYPDPEALAHMIDDPFVRPILPGHLHGQLPLRTEGGTDGFVEHPPDAHDELGFFVAGHVDSGPGVGRYRGVFDLDREGCVQLRLAGRFDGHESLRLVGDRGTRAIELPRHPIRGWRPATSCLGAGRWWVEAARSAPGGGWSFAGPATVGRLTARSEALLRSQWLLLWVGGLAWIAALATAAWSLRMQSPEAKPGSEAAGATSPRP